MNCLEFRRLVSADPLARDAALVEHRASCEACASFARGEERFSGRLRGGVALPVPDGLHKRLLLRHRIARSRRRRWPAVALGAAAVLVASASFTLVGGRDATGAAVVEHVRAEWDHGVCTPGVDPDAVDAALGGVGAEMESPRDPVTYAGTCGLGDGTIAHLVLDTPFGPVTVLVMPEEQVSARREVEIEGLLAVLLPFGEGGLAVVGQGRDGVARVESFVRAGLRVGPA